MAQISGTAFVENGQLLSLYCTLNFLDECIKPKSMWNLPKPHTENLISHTTIITILSFQQLVVLFFALFAFALAQEPSYDATVFVTSTVYHVNTATLSGC
ncbi:hypothetical protein K505DRAFT_365983 [Melanomma pulvis-pyrius CBS 109.77]|uniref:Uncharacterized protein n=1 Tax=Melanomma pulvis-pyrius CBS 109.77 TaxID=1314802 RepID=A0A6A6WYN6_9PLEO|nr:hypothetical protein K505DRAFT_365983 [Melanomma pulvis-pyrius CBS 109.77]